MRVFCYPLENAEARIFTGIASSKEIYTSPSGKKYLAIGEFWKPGISPRRIIIGTKANPNITEIVSKFHKVPEIAFANIPIA